MPRRWWVGAAALVVAAAVVSVTALAGRRAVDPEPGPATPGAPTTPADTAPAEGFVEFRDDTAGFAVSYPRDWARLDAPDPQVVLLAAPNESDSFLVRVVRLGMTVGAEQVPAMQRITDEIVTSSPGVELLAGPEQISLGGLPGYFYFYTFDDVPSGQQGVHSHYFMFKGDTMITLVFQALPETDFQPLAPTFDAIANSFRVIPT
ncbi:MAG: hypothetical protein M3276_09450 [Actinomycetota bacterium]|nr:hypothetical protein [Actinomycetota bacterium]